MKLQNFEELATSPLRKQALLIAEAGLEAVDTVNIIANHFYYNERNEELTVRGQKFALKQYQRVVLIGFGKAAFMAIKEIREKLGRRVDSGYVIDIISGDIPGVISRQGTHPLPSEGNISATKEMMDIIAACGEDDLIIMVTSGGASSLLTLPAGMTVEEERDITEALMEAGANIQEINTVRKHLSLVKGGQMAKAAYPATVINLIFSDVPGDELSTVASGPMVLDSTTAYNAMAVMKKYDVLEMCNIYSCHLHETPKDHKYFEKVHNILFCSAKDAISAMSTKAYDLGFNVRIWSEAFTGEAAEIGPAVVMSVTEGECLLGAGESVVTIKDNHHGRGGRNQEMALSALPAMMEDCVFVTVASDGRDNSDAAGAIVDLDTLDKAQAGKLDISGLLSEHNEYEALKQLGVLLKTGITGSNVSDFFICVKQ